MIKRITAIFSISFATIILLAHAVIPHHHSDGIPVISNHEKHRQIDENYCECDNHDKNQDANHEYASCVLKITFYSESKTKRTDFKSKDNFKKQHLFQDVFFSANLSKFKTPLLTLFKPPPEIKYIYLIQFKRGNGLRAPPLT